MQTKEKTKTVYITRNNLFKNIPMILMNNIINIDENFFEDNTELFFSDCDVCEGSGEKDGKKCEECYGEGSFDLEPYQFFHVDVDEWDIERLKSYGVNVGYSEKLDAHILPIYDFGTGWSAFSYSKEVPLDYELSFNETLKRETVY